MQIDSFYCLVVTCNQPAIVHHDRRDGQLTKVRDLYLPSATSAQSVFVIEPAHCHSKVDIGHGNVLTQMGPRVRIVDIIGTCVGTVQVGHTREGCERVESGETMRGRVRIG